MERDEIFAKYRLSVDAYHRLMADVGHIAVIGAMIEESLCTIYEILSESQKESEKFRVSRKFKGKIESLKALVAEIYADIPDENNINNILCEADALYLRRNLVIHSIFVMEGAFGEVISLRDRQWNDAGIDMNEVTMLPGILSAFEVTLRDLTHTLKRSRGYVKEG